MEPQTTTCALCGEQSLPAGQRRPSCECTPDGRIRLDSIDSYVRCRNPKCGKKISKACYRLIRKAAMEAFPEFTDDPVEFERILDDELGIWRAIFDDVVDSSEFHAKHSAVYSPAANGKAASFQNCIVCEDYKVRPGTRVLDDMFKNADADLDPPFSFWAPANMPRPADDGTRRDRVPGLLATRRRDDVRVLLQGLQGNARLLRPCTAVLEPA